MKEIVATAPINLAYVTCSVCGRTFSLVAGLENELCEHLKRKLSDFNAENK